MQGNSTPSLWKALVQRLWHSPEAENLGYYGQPPGVVQTKMTVSSCNHGHLHLYSKQLGLTSIEMTDVERP